ncbi:MAG: hypothetical protein NE334_17860 [Lentisphaeraceae bacterium]|nr:hypothetical protein [Lentisphaeraceae bacterium]
MKVVIIGRSDVLFETMLSLVQSEHEIVGIITAKQAPDYKITSQHFKDYALANNIPFLHTAQINSNEAQDFLKKIKSFSIGISINFPGIIDQKTINLFPLGILNSHGGDLPRYRGNACQAWALIQGEDKIGLCIHKMEGGALDSGDIICRDYFPINLNTRIAQVYEYFEKRVPELFIRALQKLSNASDYYLEKQSVNPQDALRCYPRNEDDGEIDWRLSNMQILRLINASSEPYNGAFCYYKQQKIRVWRAQIFEDDELYLAIPGQVSKVLDCGSVVIICGKGKIQIREIEHHDQRLKPSALIKGIRERLK